MTKLTKFSKVALVACESYDQEILIPALNKGFELLGGIHSFMSPREKLLLKPNILIGDNAGKSTTTHPEVLKAIGHVLKQAEAELSYGDSPAFGPPEVSARLSGLESAAASLGIRMADFSHGDIVTFPKGRLIKQFLIARGVLSADGIINLPKFKTHALMRMTGAVKNLFGCIPGMVKSEFHATLKDKLQFGQMLYDLSCLLRPRISVMDAVVGMEGNGPRNGTSRKIGLLLFSRDPSALDTVMAQLVGLEPRLIPTLATAELDRPGLFEQIDLVGEPMERFFMPDFDVNRDADTTSMKHDIFSRMVQQWISPRPVIDKDKCICAAPVFQCAQ